jgi:putative thiamine transport system permease protein
VNPARALALLLFGLPTLCGLALTLAASFNYLPALGGHGFSLAPWRRLLAEPGLAPSLRLTLSVGFGATALSLALAFAALAGPRRRRRLELALAPLLASPHSTIAVGLAFLIAPSGWIVRLLSPWLTGLTTPPDLAIVGDPLGLSLTLGLALKETPFLLAAGLAALRLFPAQAQFNAARALGYAPATAFLLVVAPQLYVRLRLPVLAVLVYSLSVVDMAVVLAPSRPAPLSMLALHGLMSPDLDEGFLGEAAAALQLGLVVGAVAVWRLLERVAGAALQRRAARGVRAGFADLAAPWLAAVARATLGLGLAALLALVVWAFAWRWPFTRAWPESFTLDLAARAALRLIAPLRTTCLIAFAASAASLALAVAWLEAEDRLRRRAGLGLVALPLLMPQIAYLFGVETLFAALRLDGGFVAVLWTHMLFVFPYVFLALADSWRALDPRYARAAAALGAGPLAALLRVKLPMLTGSLALGLAVGVSVSTAQYLATLFPGGGRVETLTTEALALAGGGDRRLSAVLGLAQALLPLLVFAAALGVPRLVFARRRGLA